MTTDEKARWEALRKQVQEAFAAPDSTYELLSAEDIIARNRDEETKMVKNKDK